MFEIILIVLGLSLFEIVSSIDNAVINADVLATMKEQSRKLFLIWGILFAVFVMRGLLPWMIVWATNPSMGAINSLVSTFSSNPSVVEAIESSAPILLIGGGTFLIFLFFHWLFMEPKEYGLIGERFIHRQWVWFYSVVSIILSILVWFSLKVDPLMAFGSVLGSTAFFITHGFKQNAERYEKDLMGKRGNLSDMSKLFYLEVIDATFSIDGVIGAFAFTLSVPLIVLGNGIGALVVRELTIKGVSRIKRYKYLKNGAMYSIMFLGVIMIADAFGYHVPVWLSPAVTFMVVGYFFVKSKNEMDRLAK
ncbi:DUF475 domain-containing protein [Candidatus Pacearchaeota archaeon]|nr:MAG: DUF475 domain-containing protein [Candidatus Pacearchaeota archaeon]